MTIRPIEEFNTAPEEKSTPPNIRPIEEFVPEPETSVLERAKDIGVSVAKGVVGTGETAVGLADIPTGGRVGKALETVGVDFPRTQQILEEQYSPAQQAANRAVREAEGFVPTLKAYAEHPSVAAHDIISSAVPSFVAGQGIGSAVTKIAPKMAPLLAGAIGEGTVTAAQNLEQAREQTPGGILTPAQVGTQVASGALTGGITLGSGRLAKALGIGDINTMLLGKGEQPIAEGLWNKLSSVAKQGVTEGLLQELPQSAQEQMASNLTLGKPIMEGVGQQAAMGLVAGTGMGVAGGAMQQVAAPRETVEAEPAPTIRPIEEFTPIQPEQRTEAKPQEPAFASPVDEDRVKSFVDRYQAAMDKGGVPTVVTAPLRTAAQVTGIYDPNDTPDVMFQKLKGFVYPESPVDTVTRELKEKLEAAPVKGVANRAALAAVEAGQAAEQQLPEYPSGMPEPDLSEELTKMSDKQLSIMFQQAGNRPEIRTAIKQERTRREAENASTIRSDTGLPAEAGQVGTRGEVDSSGNVYIPQQGPLEGSETTALGQRDTQQEPQTLPQIEEINVQSEDQAPQEAAPVEASPLEEARSELLKYTGTGDLNALTGPKNADARAKLMATVTGDESWATKKVPLTRLKKEFEKATPATPIDFAAQSHAAASPHNKIAEAAKPEDNRKAFTQFQNLPIEIENPAGTTRSGTDENGKPWSVTMKDNYGAFTGFKGADKDNVDVFIPQGLTQEQIENTKSAFVVDQINPKTGKFDEHKVVMGVPDIATAKEVYLRNYEPGWKGLGAITEMPIPELERWLGSDKTAEPVSKKLREPIHPAEVRAKEETEKLKSELVAAGIKPEIVDTVAKNYQERRFKERATDMVTGFNMASDQKPTIERAIRHTTDTGEKAHYIEADVINLGGINAYFKDHAEPANAVLRGITDIFQEAAQSAGANAIMFRQGGDEVSAVVLGGTNESIEAAIEQAKTKANEFVKQSGLAGIPHAKGKPIKGSGLHIGYSEITPDKNYTQITKEASIALNESKTKKAVPAKEITPKIAAPAIQVPNILPGQLGKKVGDVAEQMGLPEDFYEFVQTGEGFERGQRTGHYQIGDKYRTSALTEAENEAERLYKNKANPAITKAAQERVKKEVANIVSGIEKAKESIVEKEPTVQASRPTIGSTGEVSQVGNEIVKNSKGEEGAVYAALKGVEGIAKGYEKDGKIHVPFYKHVIGVDTIAPDKRANLRGLVAKNAVRINRAMSALTNAGYDYNDPLQFGMAEDKTFDLLDFSNAQKEDHETALKNNLGALARFYKEFGATKEAKAVSHVADVLANNHITDENFYYLYGDTLDGVNYRKLQDQLYGKPATNAYYATNARQIGLPNIAQTENINGVTTVLTTRPLSEKEISGWELTPVYESEVAQASRPRGIKDLFADLDPANSKKVRDAAKAEIANMPNAERIQFVEDNFYDLLLELDESGKVKIKC